MANCIFQVVRVSWTIGCLSEAIKFLCTQATVKLCEEFCVYATNQEHKKCWVTRASAQTHTRSQFCVDSQVHDAISKAMNMRLYLFRVNTRHCKQEIGDHKARHTRSMRTATHPWTFPVFRWWVPMLNYTCVQYARSSVSVQSVVMLTPPPPWRKTILGSKTFVL